MMSTPQRLWGRGQEQHCGNQLEQVWPGSARSPQPTVFVVCVGNITLLGTAPVPQTERVELQLAEVVLIPALSPTLIPLSSQTRVLGRRPVTGHLESCTKESERVKQEAAESGALATGVREDLFLSPYMCLCPTSFLKQSVNLPWTLPDM